MLDERLSLAQRLALEPPEVVEEILNSLTESEKQALLYDWDFWGRPAQKAPAGDWLSWVIMAGRGFGKTRAGAEWTRGQVYAGKQRIALIAETYKDLVEVMVYGDSGLASVFPEHEKPKIVCNPGVQIEFHTGAIALGYNATQPSQLRGPQFDAGWCDELAKWRYAEDTWDMFQFGLRLGDRPQALITTTPRNIPTLKRILKRKSTVVTHGTTSENRGNLAKSFLEEIYDRYAGTRLGRQELNAELLDDLPGALWIRQQIDDNRVRKAPALQRIVVAVDPSGTTGDQEEGGDDIGIVVAGKGVNGRIYVLADMTIQGSPAEWAKQVVTAFKLFKADRVVAEKNFGGDMVRHTIHTEDPTIPYRPVTASRGKVVRAEPVAALYEQDKVSHVGAFPELEDQMCEFGPAGYVGDGSPDRVDALVWAITDLELKAQPPRTAVGTYGHGR